MDELGKQVFELARRGLCPKDIEATLGLPAYHIHMSYHRELMDGYSKAESVGCLLSEKEKKLAKYRMYCEANKEKIRERKRRYYETHKEEFRERKRRYLERKKQGEFLIKGART
ncbi:hypothetical protein [Turicimonas muris]